MELPAPAPSVEGIQNCSGVSDGNGSDGAIFGTIPGTAFYCQQVIATPPQFVSGTNCVVL